MLVYIVKKFDKRDVGEQIDIHESIANNLIEKGIVAESIEEEKKVKTKKVKQ